MKKILRIALAQINSTVGSLKDNSDKIYCFIEQAEKYKADIIAFPELAITGYPPEDLLYKKHFVDDNLKTMESLIKKVGDMLLIIGFVDKNKKNDLFNAAALIHNGKMLDVCHKIELPNYGVFDEKRYFCPGARHLVTKYRETVIGINICEDIWTEKHVQMQAEAGAEIIINISASPYHAGKMDLRNQILIQRAVETGTYICYVNLVGAQDELVFDGSSLIISPEGKKLASGKRFKEDLLLTDIPFKDDTKPGLNKRKVEKSGKFKEVYEALVSGVKDYAEKNGFKKAVIGLSGGIDSSLTVLIACDAIGMNNVIGISMPSEYSSPETQADAKKLAENLGIEFKIIPIEDVFNSYLSGFKDVFKGLGHDITEENIQARIRGNILMALSNKFGYLVLTTGNKSELSCGYCTLYGDTAGGFSVLKDVYKTVVYELAKFRNDKEDFYLIPESVIARAPSAELRPDQKDTDNLPPYDILDKILVDYIEKDKNYEEIVKSHNIDHEIVRNVIKLVDRNEYKRRQSPIGIKITPKAFGKDRRFPITNGYREFF